MLADWLLEAILRVWPDTGGVPGWQTRSQVDPTKFNPIGVINHHTAPPVPFPLSSLMTKCNITITPSGRVLVVAAGYQYDSGLGSSVIRDAVRNDRPLPPLAGLTSTVNGNPLFFDIEVQHLGDGSPLPVVQGQALIAVNTAICGAMGWDPRYRVIGHREWAPDRKVDPRWNGTANPMPLIRAETHDMMMDVSAKDWTLETLRALQAEGLFVGDPTYYASGAASPAEYVNLENVVMRNLAQHTHPVKITQDLEGVAV